MRANVWYRFLHNFHIENKLLISLKSKIKVIIAHKIRLVPCGLVPVEELQLIIRAQLESVPNLVTKLLVFNLRWNANGDEVAVVIHLDFH